MTFKSKFQPVLYSQERNDTALKWLKLGDANHIVHQRMDELSKKSDDISIYLVSLAALCMSLELKIKGILTLEGKEFPYDHDLQRLFVRLSLESRTQIDNMVKKELKKWIPNISKNKPEFPFPRNTFQMFGMYKGAYNAMRYGDISGTRFFWPFVLDIVTKRAEEIFPEWQATRDVRRQ